MTAPATGIRPTYVLYFVGEGTLLAVRRHVFDPGGIETAVAMLFQGPDAQERRKGMTTEVPPMRYAPGPDGRRTAVDRTAGPDCATDRDSTLPTDLHGRRRPPRRDPGRRHRIDASDRDRDGPRRLASRRLQRDVPIHDGAG
ncbi:hypothetical protein [Streptomyces mirabilis]|uniref:hypothetical protein n=1 Tax=Streptomyces mirabilis TaxID=68239 RepID=UPI0036BB4A5C